MPMPQRSVCSRATFVLHPVGFCTPGSQKGERSERQEDVQQQ